MDLLKKFLGRKKQERAAPFCTAVIVAAGTASRMQGIDKILCPMGNYPLLLYTLIPFQNSDSVDEIVIVTREDLMLPIGDLCRREGMHKVTRIVKGGASRTESVLEGLHAADPKADLVAIHDGARPFLPPEVLEHTIETARTRGAAAPAIPVKDTIKVAKDGVVQATPDRSAMFFAVFKSLANIADSTFLAQLHWSSNIYNMMPFIASMIILAFTSKNSMAPKAEGIPYDKGSR